MELPPPGGAQSSPQRSATDPATPVRGPRQLATDRRSPHGNPASNSSGGKNTASTRVGFAVKAGTIRAVASRRPPAVARMATASGARRSRGEQLGVRLQVLPGGLRISRQRSVDDRVFERPT